MISMGTLIPVKLCLSNCAVFVISVSHSDVRRGRQLWVTVRWAGTNPLFECPWLDSEVQIGDLTRDLRARARDMERAKYPDATVARPAPLRVLGKRGRGEGRGDVLGSRWDSGGDSADGARALRGAGTVCAVARGGLYEAGVVPGHAVRWLYVLSLDG